VYGETRASDVLDRYVLLKRPLASDGRYTVELREFEHEISFVDQVTLAIVDHDPTVGIAVTPDGRLRTYSKRALVLSEVASTNTMREPGEVSTKGGVSSSVEFEIPEALKEGGEIGLPCGQSGVDRVIIVEAGEKPCLDDDVGPDLVSGQNAPTGGVVLQGMVEESRDWKDLARIIPRENMSSYLLDGQTLDHSLADLERLRILWLSNHQVGILEVVEVLEDECTPRPLKMLEATHSACGGVQRGLSADDGHYVELAPGETVTLTFEAPPINDGMERDFVLVSTGFYVDEKRADVVREKLHPEEYFLSHNHPNPFNPATRISYGLPKASDVELEIFDVQGRMIRKLVDTQQNAGFYHVTWDGTNSRGLPVASGVYFYRLEAAGCVKTEKMVMIR
jgi:hypothetical protein